MKRAAWIILLFLLHASAFAQTGTVVGRIKTPATIGKDYTLATPNAAPVLAQGSSGSNLCSNAKVYRVWTACVNEGGVGPLSPSADIQNGTNLRKINVTRTAAACSNEKGYLMFYCNTTDDPSCANKYLVKPGSSLAATTLEDGFIATAASQPQTIACTVTGVLTYSAITQFAGFKVHAGINRIGQGIIDVANFAGGNIGLITEAARQLDVSGPSLRYSSDSGSSFTTYNFLTRVVNVCPTCTYTDLNSACAANTSTNALPITFQLGPGVYTTKAVCSGQANVIFNGSGIGVTRFEVPSLTGDSGCIEPGTSTDWTISNMTLKCHRGFYANGISGGTPTGGGLLIGRNLELIPSDADTAKDCAFIRNMKAGTTWLMENNVCRQNGDGFTLNEYAKNVTPIFINNVFTSTPDTFIGGNNFRFGEIPCLGFSSGNVAVQNVTGHGSATLLNMYRFIGNDPGTNNCATPGVWYANSDTAVLTDLTTGVPGGGIALAQIDAAATSLGELHLDGVHSVVAAGDVTNMSTFGVTIANTTTKAIVDGGRYRTTGGIQNNSFNVSAGAGDGQQIRLRNVDYDKSDIDNDVIEGDFADLVVGQCNQGRVAVDNGGATREFCVCATKNVWGCWNMSTGAFNNNGPAD